MALAGPVGREGFGNRFRKFSEWECRTIPTIYAFAPFRLDAQGATLYLGAEPVALSKRAVALLHILVERAGALVSKDALMAAAWPGLAIEESNLTVQIAALRRALGEVPGAEDWIVTLPRRGYRFVGPVVTKSEARVSATPMADPAAKLSPMVAPALADTARGTPVSQREPVDIRPPPAEPERRQLTVMCCELICSSASALDPEDLREIVGAYHRCIAEIVTRFDGFVARHLGNTALVLFGYPVAHEDDPEQAVRAGLDLCAAIKTLRPKGAVLLHCRVGIATGVVIVGGQIDIGDTQERGIIGDALNTAARLQGLAQPDTVSIDQVTRRLVGGLFDCRDLGPVKAAGTPDPIPMWHVVRPGSAVSRFEALRPQTLTPFIGRDEEIALLLRRWEQTKAGEGRVLLLSGEPGIGKSRIIETLLERIAPERHVRLRYFCSPHHMNSALYPFIVQLERAAGFGSGSDAGAMLDKLEALIKPTAKNVPQDLALIAELLAVPVDGRYPVVEVSPQQKREMTLTALLNQLEGIAARSPVLMVFEDAHWIDPTSLDLLDRNVARVADLSVLLVITMRPELQPTWVGQPHVTMLPLSRLGRRDAAGMIAGITRGKALPDAVAEQILARTDGIPLFIEELTSSLLESGLLRENADRYALEGPLPPLAIPATLQASLVARLDRLASVKGVAQIGAAIGREFPHELIAAVASSTPADLDAALDRLTASGLISRRGTPPDATYSFKHALVRDAAYDTLLRSRRQQLHASIAKVLVERFPTMVESLPELVAHHFTEARLASEAIGYWRKAGQLASARSANREAVGFFELSLIHI